MCDLLEKVAIQWYNVAEAGLYHFLFAAFPVFPEMQQTKQRQAPAEVSPKNAGNRQWNTAAGRAVGRMMGK